MNESVGARQLHAIASPIRLELIETLRMGGVMTTAELGRAVPEARGGIQATLSDMAAAGWIRAEGGAGKSARWSVAENPIEWSSLDQDDKEVRTAQTALEQAARQRRFAYVRQFEQEEQASQWEPEWAAAVISRDYFEMMEPEDLAELESRFHEAVLDVRAQAAQRRSAGTETADRAVPVFLTLMGFPRRRLR